MVTSRLHEINRPMLASNTHRHHSKTRSENVDKVKPFLKNMEQRGIF